MRLDAKLDPAPAMGDPRLAESLIANLTDNALRYNVPGGWAEVSTATRDGHAVVTVRNTGQEIPPAELDRLFLPFQRLGARTRHAARRATASAWRSSAPSPTRTAPSLTATARTGGGLEVAVIFPQGRTS